MNNCLLCKNCNSEGGYEEGYYGYSCEERELPNDNRFPYKKTNCNKYENDTDLTSLINKSIPREVWNSITWKVSDY